MAASLLASPGSAPSAERSATSLTAPRGMPVMAADTPMSEQRPLDPSGAEGGARPARRTARRAADRHYLAVVAAEARRLARQLRPQRPAQTGARVTLTSEATAEGSH